MFNILSILKSKVEAVTPGSYHITAKAYGQVVLVRVKNKVYFSKDEAQWWAQVLRTSRLGHVTDVRVMEGRNATKNCTLRLDLNSDGRGFKPNLTKETFVVSNASFC